MKTSCCRTRAPYVFLLWAPLLAAGCSSSSPEDRATAAGDADSPTVAVAVSADKIDPQLLVELASGVEQRVIVELAEPLGMAPSPAGSELSQAARSRTTRIVTRELRRALLTSKKVEVIDRVETSTGRPLEVRYRYPAFRLFAASADEEQVHSLASQPDVVAIHADEADHAQLTDALPFIGVPWFHQHRGRGDGTAIAILDSPIRYEDGAFGNCPTAGAPGCSVGIRLSFAAETAEEVIAKEDEYGKVSHGTNVGGIALGVAPDTTLLSLNVFHSNDAEQTVTAYVSDQIAALDWVANNAETYQIVAVNLSLGSPQDDPHPCNSDARYDAIRTLRSDYGVLTTISAGNDGKQNALGSPGCINAAITVSAQFDTDLTPYDGSCYQYPGYAGEIACFSNLNGMIDLIAPGVRVEAAGITISGTSMSTPMVAGAVAGWQSYFFEQDGVFLEADWLLRRLLAHSSTPLLHTDGRRYAQLKLDQGIAWQRGYAFEGWYREAAENAIPTTDPGLQQSLTLGGQGGTVQGLYLYLEVVHLQPEHLEVSLQSPSLEVATVVLPAGQANFNGIIGRMIQPGAWSALAGSPIDGTWTLSIRDTVGAEEGHYLQGALFIAEGCTPHCVGAGCGDDECGGWCGEICFIDGACQLAGTVEPDRECRGCQPERSTLSWSALDGNECDDGNPCTVDDTCVLGSCSGTSKTCQTPPECHTGGVCDHGTGDCQYSAMADGTPCEGGSCVSGECVPAPAVEEAAPAEVHGGCGCRLPAPRSSRPWPLVGALLLLLRRGRAWRRARALRARRPHSAQGARTSAAATRRSISGRTTSAGRNR